MRVLVRFFGVLRSTVGKELVEMDIGNGGKVVDLLEHILDRMERRELQKTLFDPELHDPRPSNVILVNGREINSLNGLETVLQEGDEITLIPLIHGGQ